MGGKHRVVTWYCYAWVLFFVDTRLAYGIFALLRRIRKQFYLLVRRHSLFEMLSVCFLIINPNQYEGCRYPSRFVRRRGSSYASL